MLENKEIELIGPNFVDSANEIIINLAGSRISYLTITNINGKEVAEIHKALTLLRGYFVSNATIYISGFPSFSSENIKMIESASGVRLAGSIVRMSSDSRANTAALFQMQAMDSIQAQTIMTQTGSDVHKHQTERWKIKKDTQISIFKMEQQTLYNNMKTTDSIFSKFKNLLRS